MVLPGPVQSLCSVMLLTGLPTRFTNGRAQHFSESPNRAEFACPLFAATCAVVSKLRLDAAQHFSTSPSALGDATSTLPEAKRTASIAHSASPSAGCPLLTPCRWPCAIYFEFAKTGRFRMCFVCNSIRRSRETALRCCATFFMLAKEFDRCEPSTERAGLGIQLRVRSTDMT